MRHFVYVCSKRTVSRTYGGSNYVLEVYENQGKGKLVHLGSRKACTRGHMGEDSEAWQVVLEKLPALRNRLAREGWLDRYYSWMKAEAHGVKLQNLGGC